MPPSNIRLNQVKIVLMLMNFYRLNLPECSGALLAMRHEGIKAIRDMNKRSDIEHLSRP